jgi:hypothetical protein
MQVIQWSYLSRNEIPAGYLTDFWLAPHNPEQRLFVQVGPESGKMVFDVIPALTFITGMESEAVIIEGHPSLERLGMYAVRSSSFFDC